MSRKCWEDVTWVFWSGSWGRAVWISGIMVSLFLLYLAVVSVFWVSLTDRGTWVWKMVMVGRWSVMGGEMVPAVICTSVHVVSVGP